MRAKRVGAKGNRGEQEWGRTGMGANKIRCETTRIQGELTSTAFRLVLSAGKLNLPLVPSQDYVLQDNKRCYDKILSDWSGISDPLHWASDVFWKAWWIWLMACNFGHQFFFKDIKQFLLAHVYVVLTNDMLKAYKVAQVWSGWLQEAYFLKTKSNNNNLCILRTKCSPSQTLDDDPHNV